MTGDFLLCTTFEKTQLVCPKNRRCLFLFHIRKSLIFHLLLRYNLAGLYKIFVHVFLIRQSICSLHNWAKSIINECFFCFESDLFFCYPHNNLGFPRMPQTCDETRILISANKQRFAKNLPKLKRIKN